jgi:hypothetical protein
MATKKSDKKPQEAFQTTAREKELLRKALKKYNNSLEYPVITISDWLRKQVRKFIEEQLGKDTK